MAACPLDYCVIISRLSFHQSARLRDKLSCNVVQRYAGDCHRVLLVEQQDDRSKVQIRYCYSREQLWYLASSLESSWAAVPLLPPDPTPPNPCHLRPWLNRNGASGRQASALVNWKGKHPPGSQRPPALQWGWSLRNIREF